MTVGHGNSKMADGSTIEWLDRPSTKPASWNPIRAGDPKTGAIGETGPNARPMHPDWARPLRDQCKAAGVPFFFKQWGQFIPETCAAIDHQGAHTEQTLGKPCVRQDGETFWYVGKKAAGRLLDGREWNEFPAPSVTDDSLNVRSPIVTQNNESSTK